MPSEPRYGPGEYLDVSMVAGGVKADFKEAVAKKNADRINELLKALAEGKKIETEKGNIYRLREGTLETFNKYNNAWIRSVVQLPDYINETTRISDDVELKKAVEYHSTLNRECAEIMRLFRCALSNGEIVYIDRSPLVINYGSPVVFYSYQSGAECGHKYPVYERYATAHLNPEQVCYFYSFEAEVRE